MKTYYIVYRTKRPIEESLFSYGACGTNIALFHFLAMYLPLKLIDLFLYLHLISGQRNISGQYTRSCYFTSVL